MALWHILTRNLRGIWVPDEQAWDDGAFCRPGEVTFNTNAIEAQAGQDRLFNYVGTPNWKAV